MTLRHLSRCNGCCVWFICRLQLTCLYTYLLVFPVLFLHRSADDERVLTFIDTLLTYLLSFCLFVSSHALAQFVNDVGVVGSLFLNIFISVLLVCVCACVRVKNVRAAAVAVAFVTSQGFSAECCHFHIQLRIVVFFRSFGSLSFFLFFCSRRCLSRSVIIPIRVLSVEWVVLGHVVLVALQRSLVGINRDPGTK